MLTSGSDETRQRKQKALIRVKCADEIALTISVTI